MPVVFHYHLSDAMPSFYVAVVGERNDAGKRSNSG